jgi:hypothetical protein
MGGTWKNTGLGTRFGQSGAWTRGICLSYFTVGGGKLEGWRPLGLAGQLAVAVGMPVAALRLAMHAWGGGDR